MPAPDPFDMSPEFRKQVIDALGKLLDSDDSDDVLRAAEIVVQLDALNIQATRPSAWLGQVSQN